jgi:hypothetical protein
VSDGIARLLVTEHSQRSRFNVWLLTASYTNWLEGRQNTHGTETWFVVVPDDRREPFLDAARRYQVTVEEIEMDAQFGTENYVFLAGDLQIRWAAA